MLMHTSTPALRAHALYKREVATSFKDGDV